MNCTSVFNAWKSAQANTRSPVSSNYECGSVPPRLAYNLAIAAGIRRRKLGLGIGVPSAFLLCLPAIYYWAMRDEIQKRRTIVERARELEMVAAERMEWERRSQETRRERSRERELANDDGELRQRRSSESTLVEER